MTPLASALWHSASAAARVRRWKDAALVDPPRPARGGFPYFRRAAQQCNCRECVRLDNMRLQGIPGARQLALPF